MEVYFASSGRSSSSTDLATCSDGTSGSWAGSSIQRRRFSSPVPNAFLTPAFNACAQSDSPLDASLLRYTRRRRLSSSSSNSPDSGRRRLIHMLQLRSSLSSPKSLGKENRDPAPLKMEVDEDVLVMDGVLVMKSNSPNRTPVSSSHGTMYKTEICRSWEESVLCRYGSKCQFAHGKDEVRDFRALKTTAVEMSKSVLAAGSPSSCRDRFWNLPSTVETWNLPPTIAAITEPMAPSSPTKLPDATPPLSPKTFMWPPTEDEEKYIEEVLYGNGPSRRKRLPIFIEIIPDL